MAMETRHEREDTSEGRIRPCRSACRIIIFPSMTKWVSAIIAANVAVFLLQSQPGMVENLMLLPSDVWQHPWTPFTYMFVHGGVGHIFWNMFGLYMFGPRLETLLGGRRFIALYLLSGLGGAALSFLPQYFNVPIIGASGAVFGVLTAYARVWPKDRILLYAVIPVQASWFIVGMVVYSIAGGLGYVGAGTAHFGHLGGIAVGWGYMAWLSRNSGAKKFAERAVPVAPIISESDAMSRWAAIPVAQLHAINRDEVLRLLEKARAGGAHSLSVDERATLDRFSRA